MLIWTGRGVAIKRVKGEDKKVKQEITIGNDEEVPKDFFTPERLKRMIEKGKVTEVGVKKPAPRKPATKKPIEEVK